VADVTHQRPHSKKDQILSHASKANKSTDEEPSITDVLNDLFPPEDHVPNVAETESDLAILVEVQAEPPEVDFLAPPKETPTPTLRRGRGLKELTNGNDAPSEAEEERDRAAHQTTIKMGAAQARKTMNILSTMGPVFKRVIGNSDSDDAARLVSELLVKAESLKQSLYSVFHADHEQQVPAWLKAQLSRYAVSMVTDDPSMSLDDMVMISKKLSEFMPDLRFEYSNQIDDKTQIKLSLIKALSTIEVEINTFIENLNSSSEHALAIQIESHRSDTLDDISSFIVNKVSDAMSQLSDAQSTARTRTMMAQSLINQASSFYLSSLIFEISNFWERRVINEEKGRHQEFVEQFSTRNPEGIPLDSSLRRAESSFDILTNAVESEFDKQFDRLINFTYHNGVDAPDIRSGSEVK